MNKVILMGRLTADPEYRQTPQGVPMCTFRIAVDRPFVSKSTNQREADFFRVVAWNQKADFVSRYFTKGKPIIVEGSIRNSNYTDQNGVMHYSVDIQADNVSFCLTDNRSNGSYNNGYGNNYQPNGYSNGYGNNGYANSYNQGGYAPQGNNNYYPQPPQQQSAPTYQPPVNNSDVHAQPVNSNNSNSTQNGSASANNNDLQVGQYDDFEEILSDGEIPF
ncbi:MAG: single-stranded DNA-binding protein [Oscillospiraceae bacterium]